jgi:hypothetical protein
MLVLDINEEEESLERAYTDYCAELVASPLPVIVDAVCFCHTGPVVA